LVINKHKSIVQKGRKTTAEKGKAPKKGGRGLEIRNFGGTFITKETEDYHEKLKNHQK